MDDTITVNTTIELKTRLKLIAGMKGETLAQTVNRLLEKASQKEVRNNREKINQVITGGNQP